MKQRLSAIIIRNRAVVNTLCGNGTSFGGVTEFLRLLSIGDSLLLATHRRQVAFGPLCAYNPCGGRRFVFGHTNQRETSVSPMDSSVLQLLGLLEEPFSIAPDPAYFYLSEPHRAAIRAAR